MVDRHRPIVAGDVPVELLVIVVEAAVANQSTMPCSCTSGSAIRSPHGKTVALFGFRPTKFQ